jgi:solute:Na+ symporter, SSS family
VTALDWLVVLAYLAISLGIGVFFLRRASHSMEDYFIAGRSLPWWVIGFANCATYTGASAATVMLVFQDGLVGNFWWWASWVVWMPIVAVFWARYWRRMRIVTTAEFIELRYSGRFAKAYRTIYAIYNCCGWAPIVTGYMTGWMVVQFVPILGWTKFEIILACGLLVLLYAVVSGLFGIAYNDVFQFGLYLVAGFWLLFLIIGSFGGWQNMVSSAVAARGPEFLSPVPPSPALTPAILLALVVQGFFFAASPTAGEGTTAQKFMAARDETHAAVGQMLSAFLSLVVRVIPFILYGVAAAALYPKGSVAPELIWSQLVLRFAPAGLLGLAVAAELAGYMSTADAYMNWGGSFVTNDIYKAWLNPKASSRQLAIAGKIATIGITCLSFLVAMFLVDQMMSWFLYINAVMIAFVLPLAWLRFFWWRFNIWGEAAGVLAGLPLGYVIWFPLGFSQLPFWQGFFFLFGAGWIVILVTTWLTAPEPLGALQRFYLQCRPPGLWGPIASSLRLQGAPDINGEFRRDLWTCLAGIALCASMVVLLNGLIAGAHLLSALTAGVMAASAYVFFSRWRQESAADANAPSSDRDAWVVRGDLAVAASNESGESNLQGE